MTKLSPVRIELDHVLAARNMIRKNVRVTPVETCDALDHATGRKIFLKMENYQKTGSFKARGAANYILTSCQDNRGTAKCSKTFMTHSSGNHAVGVAWASSIIAASAHVVMPVSSSKYKMKQVLDMNGTGLTTCGNTIMDRWKAVEKLLSEHPNWEFVHPGDWKVLAGQGTVGLEIIEQVERMLMNGTSLVAGGGSLISGISTVIKALRPSIKVIGVQPEAADDAKRSLETGVVQGSPNRIVNTIADGLKTTLHDFTFNTLKGRVDAILVVSEQEIMRAMKFMYEKAEVVIEPSAAVVIAAIMNEEFNNVIPNGPVACVVTGGNIHYETFLAHISI